MKNILLFTYMLPICALAQSQADYERIVGNYMRYYNKGYADSITAQYSDEWGDMKKKLWDKNKIDELKKEYGTMRSYKFLELYKPEDGDGGGDGLALFKVVFDKSTHAMAITLNKSNELLTFRFKTYSPHIDSVLKKHK